jgi:hypothetical protein
MKFPYQKFLFQGHPVGKPVVSRPMLPVLLHGPKGKTDAPFFALLDSGADPVLMPTELAATLGIPDVTIGELFPAIGFGNIRDDVYYHANLSIEVYGHAKKLPTLIGFSSAIPLPLLGRTFFRHFKTVSFSEKNEEMELKE